MDIPKKMGIWITQKCPLRCKFCENSDDYFKEGKIMSLDIFKNKVNEIIEAGISCVDLTPIVGEVLTIPNFGDYLDILDSYKEIKSYTFITCLIGNKKKYISMRKNARKFAENSHDIREVIIKHLDLYQKINKF